ncbi:vgr related protein [Sphingomonas sp. RS6]
MRLARSVFGDAIDYARAGIAHAKWAFFQPARTVMAPLGTIHFSPRGDLYRDDFGQADLSLQGLFIHEMAHVWQHQSGLFLPIRRHPFCRYRYDYEPGKPFDRYGIEQQAEIVRHAFLLAAGMTLHGKPPAEAYRALLPFQRGA